MPCQLLFVTEPRELTNLTSVRRSQVLFWALMGTNAAPTASNPNAGLVCASTWNVDTGYRPAALVGTRSFRSSNQF